MISSTQKPDKLLQSKIVESTPTKKTAILVLGMHRSGTSCLTGILQGSGVNLGEVFTSNPYNKHGNREHARIMALNDAVLDHNGGAWDVPVEVLDWTTEQSRERDSIINELASSEARHWGFKDPRTLLTMPFWQEVIQPQLIGTFRHPLRVAMSLHQRSQMPLDDALTLWQAYNKRLLDFNHNYQFPLINFDLDADEYLSEIKVKLNDLGLDRDKIEHALSFYDKSLLHQHALKQSMESLPDKIVDCYQQLMALS